MNRDTIIGFVLIALVLIGFSWYNQPSAEQIEAQRKEDSIAAVMRENAEKKQKAENLKLTTLASQTVVNACNVVARVCQVTGSKEEAKNVLGDL